MADTLRLSLVPGIGPKLYRALVAHFGGPAAVFAASTSQLREVQGIGAKLCRELLRARDEIDVEAELALAERNGVKLLTADAAEYPRGLNDIHDPPAILYARGDIRPEDALAVAIVGSRHATHYGLEQATRLAASLARAGLTIISGLARGIDSAAHRGALEAGGRTIAVLGSGLLEIYPPENRSLADQVAASGAVISEAAMLAKPTSGMFPQRNRLISGLSLGVLVIEASLRSGALITARHAMEQGRDVFALPGRVDSRMSHGCHRLIRDGAKLVETADDVLEELGPLAHVALATDGREIHHPAELLLNEQEKTVLDVVGNNPTTIDTIVSTSGLAAHQVLATISVLEMRRLIRRTSGQTVIRL